MPRAQRTPPDTLHRSGAVARMLRMPVGTLRVWERRYGLTDTAHSAGGQRLYSADDVRRLSLLKQLTDLGHAIGTLAPLDMAALQRVAATHAQALAVTQGSQRPGAAPAASQAWRVVVVGKAFAARLQRPGVLRRIGRAVDLLGPFDDIAEAAAAVDDRGVDAWLLHEPQLHDGWLASCEAAVPAFASARKAVLYGIAADAVCDDLAARGVLLLREPQPDAVLAQWLRPLADAAPERPSGSADPTVREARAPRRWADDALADFAALSTTVACECPRHVAELLVQLSRFEAYSAQCEHRSPPDAELHAHLGRVAADARASFEAALERVAMHEGLLLPPPAR